MGNINFFESLADGGKQYIEEHNRKMQLLELEVQIPTGTGDIIGEIYTASDIRQQLASLRDPKPKKV